MDSSDENEDDDDEDLDRDEGQLIELQKDSISQEYKSISKIMQMIKEKEKGAKGTLGLNSFSLGWGKEQKKKPDSPSSLSQVSSVNPMEDPLSETSSAPVYSQKFEIIGSEKIKITTSQLQDAEMEDTSAIEIVREQIRKEDSQFE